MDKQLEWIKIANQAWAVRKERMKLEKKEKILFEQLKHLCEFQATYLGGFNFTFVQRIGNVDYSLIPELKNVDLDQYRKESIAIWKLEKD